MLRLLQRAADLVLWPIRQLLQRGFDQGLNPIGYLGSLTIFFCWIALVSGIWLLIFFRTSVDGAYQSIESIMHNQWYIGSIMRSLHRYASDAAVITLVIHIVREFAVNHHRGKHWFNWISGVPLIWLLFPLGITGYWLVWDELAHYVALSSAELLDWLPIFTDSMARNFLSDTSLSDRFFTLMVFLHVIGLPLFFVFAIWLHVFRLTSPRINPPRELMIMVLIAMVILSVLLPAYSQADIDMSRVTESLALDWFYLLVYPLIQSWPLAAVWALLTGVTVLMFLAPWLPPAKTHAVAHVDLDNCNGCERCANDCPYSAISMMPRSDGSAHDQEAVVDPDLCVSCGICVGSCPTAMPFRSRSELIPGIDLPDLSAARIRELLNAATTKLSGDRRVMVFNCHGDKARIAENESTGIVELPCMAHLPPSFLDYILSRDLADGIFMTGCLSGECKYRFGMQWTEQRIARQRDPQLRGRVDEQRIALAWLSPWSGYGDDKQKLEAFRKTLPNVGGASEKSSHAMPGRTPGKPVKALAVITAFLLFMLLPARFSNWPSINLRASDQAVVSLTFSHAGQLVQQCRKLSKAELDQLPPNMRKPEECERERQPVEVVFSVDDDIRYRESLPPTGIWGDGKVSVYQRLAIPQGKHQLNIGMRDTGPGQGYDYEYSTSLELDAGQHLVIEFDTTSGSFTIK